MFPYNLRHILSLKEIKQRVESGEGFQLLDVRHKKEFEQRHLPNAISLPLEEIEEKASQYLDPNIPLLVYGYSDHGAQLAVFILMDLGYHADSIGTMTKWPYDTITHW